MIQQFSGNFVETPSYRPSTAHSTAHSTELSTRPTSGEVSAQDEIPRGTALNSTPAKPYSQETSADRQSSTQAVKKEVESEWWKKVNILEKIFQAEPKVDFAVLKRRWLQDETFQEYLRVIERKSSAQSQFMGWYIKCGEVDNPPFKMWGYADVPLAMDVFSEGSGCGSRISSSLIWNYSFNHVRRMPGRNMSE
jgi:hypothetical protein